jgi:hypothetical protein
MAEKAKVKRPALGVLSSTRSAPVVKGQTDNSDLDAGKISPVGVGLKEGERKALKAMAAQYEGLTLNALMRFALRRFIVQVRAGEINLENEFAEPEPQKPRFRLPS